MSGPNRIDLANFIQIQTEFSIHTFGPGERTEGVSDHIRKELIEIQDAESAEERLKEWVDVILLAIDGAQRTGASPDAICDALREKLLKNMRRDWPDWRTADPDKAIEHVKQEQV